MYRDIPNNTGGVPGRTTGVAHRVNNSICAPSSDHSIYIDAGTRYFRLQAYSREGALDYDSVVPSNTDLYDLPTAQAVIAGQGAGVIDSTRLFVTGKLAASVIDRLGGGNQILPAVETWRAAQELIELPRNNSIDSLAIIDLSASGYLVVGVESGRIRTLLSAEGDVDEEALTLAVLKAVGPLRYYQSSESVKA